MNSDPVAPLGDVCTFLNGGTPSRSVDSYWNGTIPWITGADIEGPEVVSWRSLVTEGGLKASATNLVPAGTLLLVTRTSVGKVAAAGVDLCFSQDITAVIPDESRLDKGYLRQFLASQAQVLKSAARGATIKGVTRQDVADLRIPLPPLGEQRRIAGILDAADALRAKRRESIALLDSLNESLIEEIFRIAEFPLRSLGELSLKITKGTTPTSIGLSFADAGVPFLRVQNLVNRHVDLTVEPRYVSPEVHDQLSRSQISPGDVLVSIAGTVGRVALVDGDAGDMNCNQAVAIVRPKDDIDGAFLAACLTNPNSQRQFARSGVTGTITNLSLGQLAEVLVPVPPRSVQITFAEWSAQSSKLEEGAHKSSGQIETLFSALQARAFRGEL